MEFENSHFFHYLWVGGGGSVVGSSSSAPEQGVISKEESRGAISFSEDDDITRIFAEINFIYAEVRQHTVSFNKIQTLKHRFILCRNCHTDKNLYHFFVLYIFQMSFLSFQPSSKHLFKCIRAYIKIWSICEIITNLKKKRVSILIPTLLLQQEVEIEFTIQNKISISFYRVWFIFYEERVSNFSRKLSLQKTQKFALRSIKTILSALKRCRNGNPTAVGLILYPLSLSAVSWRLVSTVLAWETLCWYAMLQSTCGITLVISWRPRSLQN